MGVGIRLKKVLHEKGKTIKQLAEESHIPVNTLYSITKKDPDKIDKYLLYAISTTLGVPQKELYDGFSDELSIHYTQKFDDVARNALIKSSELDKKITQFLKDKGVYDDDSEWLVTNSEIAVMIDSSTKRLNDDMSAYLASVERMIAINSEEWQQEEKEAIASLRKRIKDKANQHP